MVAKILGLSLFSKGLVLVLLPFCVQLVFMSVMFYLLLGLNRSIDAHRIVQDSESLISSAGQLQEAIANVRLILIFGLLAGSCAAVAMIVVVRQSLYQRLSPALKRIGKVSRQFAMEHNTAPADEITELEQIAENLEGWLQDAHRKERAMVDNAVDVICTLDENQRFVSASPSATRVLGYAPNELVGKEIRSYVENTASQPDGQIESLFGHNKSTDHYRFETRWKRSDGTVVDILWSAHWSSTQRTLFSIGHDITDRKRVERLLQESESRIRLILETIPVGVLIADESGRLEFVNHSVENLTQFSYRELVPTPLSTLFPDVMKGMGDNKCIELLRPSNIDKVIMATRKSGETFPVEVTITDLVIEREKKLLLVLTDVSERLRMEQLKREFVAMISHDIKTPLSSIGLTLSFLEVNAKEKLDRREFSLVQQAAREIERLSTLPADLLDLEKMDAGKFSLRCENISMLRVIESAVTAISRSADQRGVAIRLPANDVRCDADGARLIQVLVNLVSNAVKFSPRGKPVMVSLDDQNDVVKVTVQDHGPGIPADKTGLIFEKFRQAEVSHQKSGSGLGLAICKAIIEQHDGEIGVDSVQGRGSSFWFTLPKKQP